jgi:hypothetical protein
VSASSGKLSETVRRIAAAAWAFRVRLELEAESRFARLAEQLAVIGAADALVDLTLQASVDDRRQARICAELAERCGARLTTSKVVAPEIAPAGLMPRGRCSTSSSPPAA